MITNINTMDILGNIEPVSDSYLMVVAIIFLLIAIVIAIFTGRYGFLITIPPALKPTKNLVTWAGLSLVLLCCIVIWTALHLYYATSSTGIRGALILLLPILWLVVIWKGRILKSFLKANKGLFWIITGGISLAIEGYMLFAIYLDDTSDVWTLISILVVPLISIVPVISIFILAMIKVHYYQKGELPADSRVKIDEEYLSAINADEN